MPACAISFLVFEAGKRANRVRFQSHSQEGDRNEEPGPGTHKVMLWLSRLEGPLLHVNTIWNNGDCGFRRGSSSASSTLLSSKASYVKERLGDQNKCTVA